MDQIKILLESLESSVHDIVPEIVTGRPMRCVPPVNYVSNHSTDMEEDGLDPSIHFKKATVNINTDVDLINFQKDDWYISKTHPKYIILSLLFIIYQTLTKRPHSIIAKYWIDAIKFCEQLEVKFPYLDQIICMPWQKVKDIVNSMLQKYKKEEDHKKLESMYREALIVWRNPELKKEEK